MGQLVLVVMIAIALVVFGATSLKIVRPWEKGLVERLGRFKKVANSGILIIIPIFENMVKVDMREAVIDVPPQEVITKDNVVVTVDAVVYTEVTDPVKVKYNIENFYIATIKLAQTNLRNLIGDMSLDQSLTSRDSINVNLRQILDDATDKWGVRVTRVELQRIEPPADVTHSMHQQMKAERERRATVLTADGHRESAIKVAEGQKQSEILKAEGQAEAIRRVADAEQYQKLTVAEGEAQAIERVYQAIHNGNPTNDLIAIKYLESLVAIADGKANKVFFPMETSGIMGSIGCITELMKDKFGTPETGSKG